MYDVVICLLLLQGIFYYPTLKSNLLTYYQTRWPVEQQGCCGKYAAIIRITQTFQDQLKSKLKEEMEKHISRQCFMQR